MGEGSAPRQTAADPPAQSATEAFWSRTPEELRAALGVAEAGLTTSAADAALARTGANVLDAGPRRTAWLLLAHQFLNPIELILIGATVLAGFLGDWTDSLIILVILVASGLLGFAQEYNAGRAVSALLASVEVTCSARRDGALTTIPVSRIVPGDRVEVRAGDLVPGDCLVVESVGLTVDESALTGETFPVEKGPGIAPAASPIPARSCAVFFGTHVASGSGTLLVARTGRSTEISSIAARLERTPPRTGFEKGMTRFGLLLSRAMLVLVVVIFLVNLVLQRPPLDSALFALALAVGLTPQLLPAIVAIGLSHGARAMARRRVIVRRLDAIEDIGSMTVLCCDKTGTMTEGRIELGQAVGLDGADDPEVAWLAALNAGLQTGWSNPIDDAVLAAHPLGPGAVRLGELPYDFLRRRVTVRLRRSADADPLLVTKGALDSVIAVCTDARTRDGLVPIAQVEQDVHRRAGALADDGFRVLAVATRPEPHDGPLGPGAESGMTLVGLLTFADAVKPDAPTILAELAASGVSVRMVTGDNHLVARHVATQVGLDASAVYTGREIDAIGDDALARAVEPVHVFAELDPVQKERVIRAFGRAGHVVGYLGDGINDAPSLHAADVGITVDTAVPVAKQSAAVVLLDKSLEVLLDGIREGRRTFANTMKYIFVTTSANFGNMLSMAVASALLPFLPLLASQILVINLLSDLPSTMIATDAVDDAQLRRPQRWDLRLIRTYMIVFGTLSSVFDLLTFAALRLVFHAGAAEFRSAWMLGSILTEVGALYILRTRGAFFRSRPATGLVVASVVVVAITVWLPYSPVAGIIGLVPIPAALLAVIIVMTLVYLAANELLKRRFWAWEEPRGHRDR